MKENIINDAKNFIEALTLMSEGKEFDININIPVSGGAFYDCLAVNGEICAAHPSPIFFGGDRLIYPHVTLKMGTVLPDKAEEIFIKLGAIFSSVRALQLRPLPVILKSPENKYYFSEIENGELFSLSATLDSELNKFMAATRHPFGADNLHHITLGYKPSEEIPAASVKGCVRPFVADRAVVSVKGKYGVCIGAVKTFAFNN